VSITLDSKNHLIDRSMNLLRSLLIGAALQALQVLPAWAQSADSQASDASSTVRAYHEALASGDSKSALRLLADDAVIMEGGDRETREEYATHHLAADIQFAQAVRTVHSNIAINVSGEVAWVSSTSMTTGTYRGRAISSNGAELMVLSKTPTGWVIRAIHWSSQ
jgi:ketosteroid isomerase-like protein